MIPAGMSAADEARWVGTMRQRFERRRAAETTDLAQRAEVLATRYRLPAPASVRWVDNQAHRWGSCTPADRSIRLSTRLAGFPGWVVDYVIVHELAHLVVAAHDRRFWELVNRYPRAERSRGFLLARGGDDAGPEAETGPALIAAPAPPTARRATPAAGWQTLW
ncbi:MAG: M48 metallopeptidase family protein [Acidimicrobiales bacterium]